MVGDALHDRVLLVCRNHLLGDVRKVRIDLLRLVSEFDREDGCDGHCLYK